MKITAIKTVVVNAQMRNWIFIKVERWEVVQHSLKTENGYWLPTDAPGLGIEVNEAAAAQHPFQQEVIHALHIRAHDNAILDW